MAVPLTLGPFMFQSLNFGFNGLSRNLATPWAGIQIAGGLNRLQWTGGDGDDVSIEGVIFPEEFGGMETLEGIRAAAAAGLTHPLISLSRAVYGMHIIEGVVPRRQRSAAQERLPAAAQVQPGWRGDIQPLHRNHAVRVIHGDDLSDEAARDDRCHLPASLWRRERVCRAGLGSKPGSGG